jgi:NAD(P)-dependent dehydrogenase (short-subunit alcohol dehydrogenase family)
MINAENLTMANELNGKTIMVTGACGGVGYEVAHRLAQAGARLALVDTRAERIPPLIESLGGDTSRFAGYPANLNDANVVDSVLDQSYAQFGALDGLVHTVGGFAMGDPVDATNMDVFDRMMTLNARILYLVGGKVARRMMDAGTAGSIALVLARAADKGAKNMAAYTASKAAGQRIMESMALELRDANIRVNGVSPSIVDTEANRQAMSSADFDRWVKPEQIGDLMVFLMSDESTAITGASIDISGRV